MIQIGAVDSNVQRTFKDGKIKSTALTRPHAMKRRKMMSPVLSVIIDAFVNNCCL